MPPFAGEGMCAAFRDVYNLIWRLDLVLQNQAKYELFDEWSEERCEGAKWYINFSVDLGKVICITDEQEAAQRDAKMIAEYKANPHPVDPHDAVLGKGTWNSSDKLAGKPSIQGLVAHAGRTGLFDATVGRGWFLLHQHGTSPGLTPSQQSAFEAIGGRVLSIGAMNSGAEVLDLDGSYAAWFDENKVNYMLVRPDYYIAATAEKESQLSENFSDVMKNVVAA
jgi:3-(3-hydroxy-phenyl)propionate hydroxylase